MRLMGILNVTPDSFSDGGLPDPVGRGLRLLDEGADCVDVGGESTRPGADPVDPEEERRRVLPVIAALRAARPMATLSVDTRRASVAAAAIEAGADLVNDVSGGADPDMFRVCAGRPMVLMHMRAEPRTMADHTDYRDVVAEVWEALDARAAVATAAGVGPLWLDPGIGFAKTPAQSLELLRRLPRRPRILVGASRKRFIGELTGQADPATRIEGSLAVALHCAARGVDLLRVHDVAATRRALQVWAALQG